MRWLVVLLVVVALLLAEHASAQPLAHANVRVLLVVVGILAVILPAAYLHDIGIHEAQRKYNSTAAKYQEKEGPPIARDILERLEAVSELIDEVCDIVGHHHHPRPKETVNFKVVYDSDLIVNLDEKNKEKPIEPERLKEIINKSFLTEAGREEAKAVFLQD